MKRSTIALSVALVLLLCSCIKKATTKTANCEGVACTMSFAMINVTITDASGKPVVLDSFYTLRANGEKIYYGSTNVDATSYTLLDDSYLKKLQNTKDNFTLVGYRNGTKLVNEPYVLSADCCHVKMDSGKKEIKLP